MPLPFPIPSPCIPPPCKPLPFFPEKSTRGAGFAVGGAAVCKNRVGRARLCEKQVRDWRIFSKRAAKARGGTRREVRGQGRSGRRASGGGCVPFCIGAAVFGCVGLCRWGCAGSELGNWGGGRNPMLRVNAVQHIVHGAHFVNENTALWQI